ncbi:hypothetical protein [Caldimonas brevitalea]|uniref:Uncharacterized protein n=1 Tax=Caldimonas brevitalea TaxID=413882 RepID=A0A0G3BVQ0_9BURK|nr:hypothetical protein [Caldimonas brevitalea]AKJ31446.1 hypothetical protein AAW51_4755 [Caldimonas brevitalea]
MAGGTALWLAPSGSGGERERHRAIWRAVTLAVLDGQLPADPALRDAEVLAQVDRIQAFVATVPPATRHELSQLLTVLGSAPGRRLLAGLDADWGDASVAEVQQALDRLRLSRLALRQQAYHALRDLSAVSFYATPTSWAALGYPGPTDI